MIYIRIFLLMILLPANGLAHDIRLAIFELSETQPGQYNVSVSFDKDDLTKAIPSLKGSLDRQEESILEYLHENFRLTLNDKCVETALIKVIIEDDFIRIRSKIVDFHGKIEKINVYNTCLIEQIDGHSNIFKSLVNGKSRLFRLTEDRISTEFSY